MGDWNGRALAEEGLGSETADSSDQAQLRQTRFDRIRVFFLAHRV